MTQLILKAYISYWDNSERVEKAKLEKEALMKDRSMALGVLVNMPKTEKEAVSKTEKEVVSTTLSTINLKLGEIDQLVKSQKAAQEAAKSKLKELCEGFRFRVKSGPKL